MFKVSDIPDQVLSDIAGAFLRRLEMTGTEAQSDAERRFQRIVHMRTAMEWMAIWLNEREAASAEVPDGYVLVPKVPDEDMVEAGVSSIDGKLTWYEMACAYRAMLAAAQQEKNNV